MKRQTLKRHTKIANDILFYIYTHIDTHIDIEELSRDLGVSKFHMHRIFKEVFDKNIYENIKSIRLQKASNLLLTNKYSTISEIAMLCGYSSHSSFLKVFKERFGMTPKAWRNGGYKSYSARILKQSEPAMRSDTNFSGTSPTIVKMPTFQSYYIRHKGYDSSIRQTWQKLHTWVLDSGLSGYKQIALFHDNPTITPLDECQYIACIVPEVPADVVTDRIPQFTIADGIYAKFDFRGTHGEKLRFIHWIYHEWLPQSDYETTTKPSYAVYRKNNFLSEDNESDLSFYVSIRY